MRISKIIIQLFIVFSLTVIMPVRAEQGVDDVIKDALGKLLERRGEAANGKNVPTSKIQMHLSFAPLVKQVAPSVVNVYAVKKAVRRSPFAGDPFFERFFGKRGPRGGRQRNQSSLGSGVIVASSGIIVTNHHVIKGASSVKISLADGREFECEIILRDKKSDLAILKTKERQNFPAIQMGDSEAVEVGDLVLAIGNPFGVGQTVTSGIVSAVARSRRGISDFGFFLQTDASINPGNSGGALVDMNGRLIGINTAIYSKSGGSNGIGFAIPSNMVQVVVRSSETGDKVKRPWIGASFQTVTSDIAGSLGMRRPRGALVVSVADNSPAKRAGMRAGDVIVAINEQPLQHLDAMGYRLTTIGIGGVANFEILSKGKKRTVSMQLLAAPETVPREVLTMPEDTALGGATVANLSPAVSQEISLPGNKKGVVVMRVVRRSPAAQNGMRPLDIIREINGVRIKSSRHLQDVAYELSDSWEIMVDRKGRQLVFARQGNFFRQFLR
ncbi:MAG: Do family serine endopeptidase [Rhizobiaceae bacterium]